MLISGALFTVLSLMDEFLEFPESSVTVIDRVPLSLKVSHDVIGFQFIDSLTAQLLETLSVHDATITSHISNWFPLMRITFHHVISISDALRVIVGATVSNSSESLLHAVNKLAAVQIHMLVVIAHVRGAVVVMVFIDVGKNEDATIHVVVRALLIALLVLSINLAVLLFLADSWEIRLFNLVMGDDILYIKIIILIILIIILCNKSSTVVYDFCFFLFSLFKGGYGVAERG